LKKEWKYKKLILDAEEKGERELEIYKASVRESKICILKKVITEKQYLRE